MGCLIYGVMWRYAHRPLPGLRGVGGSRPLWVGRQTLCAVASRHAQQPPPTEANLLAFSAAVDALSQAFDIIPMRFGVFMQDQPAISNWLIAEEGMYASLLCHIAGCVEIGLRYRSAPETPVPTPAIVEDAGPGHAYLARRTGYYGPQEQSRARDEKGRQLVEALFGLHCAYHFDPVADGLAGMQFLVPREQTEEFLARCQKLASQDNDLLYLTGPCPPYSFVNASSMDIPHGVRAGG